MESDAGTFSPTGIGFQGGYFSTEHNNSLQ